MGLEHVETQNITSATSSVDFTNVFASDDGADRYVIFVDNLVAATDQDDLRIRFSSDGGSTWDSGASDYARSRHLVNEAGATAGNGSSGEAYIGQMPPDVGNDAANNDTCMCKFVVHEPTNSSRATVLRGEMSKHLNSTANSYAAFFGGGERLTQSAVDSIQFLMESGNISSGIFSVHRVTQSAGQMDHIETIEASSQATVDFDGVFGASDGYDRYQIFADNVIPASDGVVFQIRLSSDGGSTWDSGASDYAYANFVVIDSGVTATSGGAGADHIRAQNAALGNSPASNHTNSINLTVSDPTDANRATVLRIDDTSKAGDYTAGYSGGIRLTQSAVDSIQFLMSSGNISSGIFSVYGIGS